MYRNARQAKILEIIGRQEIETQEELCAELNKLNFNVTQATVSRDIKELRLYKVAGSTKKYKYVGLDGAQEELSPRMLNLFRESVLSINYANNIIVIKTLRGNGQGGGSFVDSLQIGQIIGCVAGDDTVVVIVDSNENTPVVADKLREYLL